MGNTLPEGDGTTRLSGEPTFKPGELFTGNRDHDVIRDTPWTEGNGNPVGMSVPELRFKWTIKGENPIATKQAERVLFIAKEVLDHFLKRNADYGEAADELGSKAQFVDMNRKFKKLKAGLWEGQELVGEPVEEIITDLIGHCLLTLDILQREKETRFLS